MPDLTVRPTRKRIIAGYIFCLALLGGWAWLYFEMLRDKPRWLLALGLVPLIVPLWSELRRRFTVLQLDNGKLRYRSGLATLSTRLVDVTKVRDVQVEQGMLDRMLGVGAICVETIGESGRIVMTHIDHPHKIAEAILDAGKGQGGKVSS